MKKIVLAFALFAFVGGTAVEAVAFNGGEKEKTEKKEKKNKKNKKNCSTEEMKACSSKEGASAGKSCCAKKASASTQTPSAPAQ